MSFTFGISELDNMYKDILKPKSLVIIAGHPGAGKTTFAVTICYSNALKNHKVLYLTLQEDKDKLYNVMKGLGIDLTSIEKQGLFRFVKIPVTLDFRDAAEWILNTVSAHKPEILVIDSINALLGPVVKDEEKRAWLQNFFYELPRQINGIVILIAELPFGSEELGLGAIEFVADAIFILKHRVKESRLVRIMEIRKARGAPITVAEIPFSIVSGKGLQVFPPPILEQLPREGEEVEIPFKTLVDRGLAHIHRGFTIYITYPPDARSWVPFAILAGVALANDIKVLGVSYAHSPKTIRRLIVSMFERLGLENAEAEKIVDKYMILKGINPFAYSLSQLYAYELELIERYRRRGIGMVIFADVSLLMYHHREAMGLYVHYLANQLSVLKKNKLIVVRVGSYINNELYRINAMLSDVILRVIPVYRWRGRTGIKLMMWRRWSKAPYVLTSHEVEEILREARTLLEKVLESSQKEDKNDKNKDISEN